MFIFVGIFVFATFGVFFNFLLVLGIKSEPFPFLFELKETLDQGPW